MVKRFLLSALFIALVRLSLNAQLSLDPNFGNQGGYTRAALNGTVPGSSELLARWPFDGSFLLFGHSLNNFSTSPILAKFNADGSPDISFSPDPKLFGPCEVDLSDMIIQPVSGEILVVKAERYSLKSELLRLRADGTLDNAFTPPQLPAGYTIRNILPFPDDGFYMLAAPAANDFILMRCLSDGRLDPTFGADGKVTGTDIWIPYSGNVLSIAPDDGKILVCGAVTLGADDFVAVRRYRPDGQPDLFGANGEVVTKLSAFRNNGGAVAAISGGKILTCGLVMNQNNRPGVIRLTAQGTPDVSFGLGGITYLAGVSDFFLPEIHSLVPMPNGDVLVAGSNQNDLIFQRLRSTGGVDANFKSNNALLSGNNHLLSMAPTAILLPDGNILLNTPTAPDFGAALFLPNGSLDPNFGVNGLSLKTFERSGDDWLSKVILLPDNKILALGGYTEGRREKGMLARFTPDGQFDTGFGANGVLPFTWGDSARFSFVHNIAQHDGKIIVLGEHDYLVALRRFLPNGQVDSSFGANGSIVFPEWYPREPFMAIGPTGDIFVASAYHDDVVIRKIKASGSVDAAFGNDGAVFTSISNARDVVKGVLLQGDKILLGVEAYNVFNTTKDVYIARFNLDGTPDISFGNGGSVKFDYAGLDTLQGFAVLPDGSMFVGVVGGKTRLHRLQPNGQPDLRFGADGVAEYPNLYFQKLLSAEPDGTSFWVGYNAAGFVLIRVLEDGSLDPSFGTGGLESLLNPVSSCDTDLSDFALQVDGNERKVLAAGIALNLNYDGFIARYAPLSVGTFQPEDEQLPDVQVFPNPAFKGEVALVFKGTAKASDQCRIEISSSQGRILRVFSENQTVVSGNNHLKVNFDGLPTGLLFLRVVNGNGQSLAAGRCLVMEN